MLEWLSDPNFMPHGYCLRWQPGLLWTHVISDIGIALAYFSIPAMIIYYLRKRTAITEIPGIYLAVGAMFACFIVFCGLTHVMGMITIWQPMYSAQGAAKVVTAAVSIATALALIPILPKALSLRTAEELEEINARLQQEVLQRKEREQELAERNLELREQVEARTRAEAGEQTARQEKTELEATLHELRVTQARLVESEKLASLGKSMSGIAHEVNTPVGVSITAISTLQDALRKTQRDFQDRELSESGLADFFETANRASELVDSNLQRAAGLLQSVKQVAVDQSNDQVREVAVAQYLQLVLASIKPKLIAARQTVEVDCEPGLSLVTRPGAIAQIVTNLVLNALTHAYADEDDGKVRLQAREVDGEVELRCEDTGRGIPAELQEKIFEPFFTTRSGDGGTGIGLDIVKTLVTEKLNGNIELRSRPGEGTQFIIRMPKELAVEESA